jgi:hypothetical protein
MLMKALKQGFRVSEVASHEYERRWGTSKVVVWKLWMAYEWSLSAKPDLMPRRRRFDVKRAARERTASP